MQNISILKRILFPFTSGIVLALYIFQQSDFTKDFITHRILSFKVFENVDIKFEISKINFFTQKISLEDIIFYDHKGRWFLKAKNLDLKFKFWDIFVKKEINLKMLINNVEIFSTIKNSKLSILKQIKKFFLLRNESFKIDLLELKLSNGLFEILDESNNLNAKFKFKADIKNVKNEFKAESQISNGILLKSDEQIFTNIKSSLTANFPINKPQNTTLNFNLDGFSQKYKFLEQIFIEGDLKDQSLNLNIKNSNHLIDIGNIQITFFQDKILGDLNFQNINFFKFVLEEFKLNFKKSIDFKANFSIKNKNLKFTGFCDLTKDNHLKLETINETKIIEPFQKFFINPGDLKFELASNDLKHFVGQLKAKIGNRDNLQNPNFVNINAYYFDKLTFDGKTNQYSFKGFVDKANEAELHIFNEVNKDVAKFVYRNDSILSVIDLEIFKKLAPFDVKNFTGQAIINLNSKITKKNKIKGGFFLTDCSIVIPNSYSIIKNIKFNFKFVLAKKVLKISDFVIELNRGSIESKSAIFKFNQFSESPIFIYMPIIVKGLNLNLNKDIVTNLSARLTLKKNSPVEKPLISGDITVQNLYVNNLDTIFSGSSKTEFNKIFDSDLNINVINVKPIKLKTNQLKFSGYSNLQVIGTTLKPLISGNIELSSGKIKFPYKDLKIVNGKISISNDATLIDINAKNKIKNYLIIAHIYGDIKNPAISLSSSPELTENQIGSLLIAGTQEASLNTLMPGIIMQNLQDLIFKSDKPLVNEKNPLLKQLKNIKFVSTVDDIHQRSVKGGIEINLSDKLHAQVQRNISNQATDFEVDYALSDDISIRGIKDEDGDLSGELEFKWRV